MISPDEREKHVNFLLGTDGSFARAKTRMISLVKTEKTILAQQFLLSSRKTDKQKDAESRISPAYLKWRDDYADAFYDYETLNNQRTSASLVIDLFRSELSAYKQGIIV